MKDNGNSPAPERTSGDAGGVDNATPERPQDGPRILGEYDGQVPADGCQPGFWSDSIWHPCLDGKFRRVSPQPQFSVLAHGIPRDCQQLRSRLELLGVDPISTNRIITLARKYRVGCLRGYGNAIVPPLATQFIRAAMDCIDYAPNQS